MSIIEIWIISLRNVYLGGLIITYHLIILYIKKLTLIVKKSD